MKTLAIIPARKGSKRLPGKNTKEICGKPLIQWTIDQAKKSDLIDEILVCSDDLKICGLASKSGVNSYCLSKDLTTDISSIYDVIFDVLKTFDDEKYDVVALLEPTSPLRKDDDIDNAIQLFLDNQDKVDSLVSVGEIMLENPEIVKFINQGYVEQIDIDDYYMNSPHKYYFPYGVIYISKVEALKKHKTFYQERTIPYFIERWQNYEINDSCDFLCVEAIMKWKNF